MTRRLLSFDEQCAYLRRIGIEQTPRPTLADLGAIHWAHLTAVPFENLDINPLGRPLSLKIDDLYAKIVERNRGGYCFEVNELLATLLESLGFGVTRHAMRFLQPDGSEGHPFDHLTLLVTIPSDPLAYRVDVGAGRYVSAFPLPFIDGDEFCHAETEACYRHRQDGNEWILEIETVGSVWAAHARFDPTPRDIADFEERNRFFQSDSESYFRQGSICSRNVVGGRLSLSSTQLIETHGEVRTETNLDGESAWRTALKSHFDIELDDWHR